MNNDLQIITDLLKNQYAFFTKKYHVQRLGVFGSVARGDHTPSSDADILVEFSEPVGLFTFIELEEQLEKLLHRDVDLVTKNALKPLMRDAILKQAIYV